MDTAGRYKCAQSVENKQTWLPEIATVFEDLERTPLKFTKNTKDKKEWFRNLNQKMK